MGLNPKLAKHKNKNRITARKQEADATPPLNHKPERKKKA